MTAKIISNNVFWSAWHLLEAAGESAVIRDHRSVFTSVISALIPDSKVAASFGFSSARGALLFTLKELQAIQPQRKEVVVPGYICSGVMAPIVMAGLTPVFSEIGSDLNIHPASCLRCVGSQTLAVVVPHTYGFPAQIQQLYRNIKAIDNAVMVIDDAAAGLGNKVDGGYLGTFGDIGIVSFNQAKAFPATGGGGLLLCNPALLEKFTYGYRNVASYPPGRKLWEVTAFLLNYKFPLQANLLNYRTTRIFRKDLISVKPDPRFRISSFDVQLLNASLEKVKAVHSQRKVIMEYYFGSLAGTEGLHLPHLPGDYFLSRFCVVINGIGRTLSEDSNVLNKLRSRGIFLQRGYPTPVASSHNLKSLSTLVLGDDVVVLPVNHEVPLDAHSRVVEAILDLATCH